MRKKKIRFTPSIRITSVMVELIELLKKYPGEQFRNVDFGNGKRSQILRSIKARGLIDENGYVTDIGLEAVRFYRKVLKDK